MLSLLPRFRRAQWGATALIVLGAAGCGGGSQAATEAKPRPSTRRAPAPTAATAPNSGPSLAVQARRFRRYVRREFAGVSWASTITDAYVGGFVPTLNASTVSLDPEVARSVCGAINLWIVDTDSRYAELGKVRHNGEVVATCRPNTETELGDG